MVTFTRIVIETEKALHTFSPYGQNFWRVTRSSPGNCSHVQLVLDSFLKVHQLVFLIIRNWKSHLHPRRSFILVVQDVVCVSRQMWIQDQRKGQYSLEMKQHRYHDTEWIEKERKEWKEHFDYCSLLITQLKSRGLLLVSNCFDLNREEGKSWKNRTEGSSEGKQKEEKYWRRKERNRKGGNQRRKRETGQKKEEQEKASKRKRRRGNIIRGWRGWWSSLWVRHGFRDGH